MRSRSLRALALGLVFSLPLAVGAQTPFNLDSKSEVTGSAPVGGKTSIDLIRVDAMPTVPLRNGGVVPQSEMLQLDGKALQRGTEYSVDYASGTVYLKVPIKVGQTLRAQYRYDPAKANVAANGTSFGAPGNIFSLNMTPSTGVVLGFGMTERLQDGTMVSSNVYGLKNNFSLGQGNIKGLFVVSERKGVKSESLFDFQSAGGPIEEGKSQALVQNMETKVLGGSVDAGVQRIGEKFSGFGAFQEAGFDQKQVGQLQKEKGLSRVGFGLNKIGLGDVKLSSGYRSVKDNTGAIEWRNYGVEAGPLSFTWNGQKVDPMFGRFQDLAEGDREWLAKEKGLDRQTMKGALNLKGGKVEFTNRMVEDTEGKGIVARSANVDFGVFKLGFSDQHVESGFSRFGSLRDAEAGQWAKETGLRRQAYSLEMKPAANMRLANSTIRTDAGDYKASDVTLGGKNWTFEHYLRSADAGFASVGAMSEPEIQSNLQAIAKMYEPTGQGLRGEDRNWFFQTAGIERQSWRLTTSPVKGLGLTAEQVDIDGAKDGTKVDKYTLTAKNFSLGFRHQDIGKDFAEIGKVTDFERARLGTIQGLDRTDITFTSQIDKNRTLTASQMRADGPTGEASRQQVAYGDKSLQVNYTKRSVENGFDNVNQLVDPEKDLFMTLRGFDQTDLSLKWSPYKSFKVDLNWIDAKSDALDQQRVFRNSQVLWNPDKYTQIAYNRLDQRNDDPTQLLYGNEIERIAFSRNFGRLGTISYAQENRNFDGTQTDLPDSRSQTVAFETKITDKTAIRTEQTKTQYSNGEEEHVSQNTLSAEVTKRTGVSVTETRINRDGEKPDETKRNYGFWWDLGKGMRFAYGYARQLSSLQPGTMSTNVSLTPGEIQGVKVDAANYNTNRWDNTRNQSTGAVSLSTVKPLQLGFFQDFTFNLSANTLRDNNAWAAENDRFGVGWRIGSNTFGYQYFSQITPSGDRAIDRQFSFATDQSDKRWLKASINYKIRTLPSDQQVMVRNFSITAKPTKGLELTHQLLTNPEQARGDVILGSLVQPTRSNKWKLDYTGSESMKAGLSWEELMNEQNKTLTRIGGINLTLFANNPSPLTLFYGVEQGDLNGQRRTAHRYSLRFDQRPGPNQLFSLFVGNLSWQHSRAEDQKLQNWNVRMEYQLRF
ncbi:MAG: hypothetical protein K1X67_23825 [Fimbriimonadaceae bacterium]|nr:hypothetical protein [Fimbriimonadaceae bacterium]